MLRIVLGVVGGFVGWMVLWVGSEKALSVLWPAFGVHQRAFEGALKDGGEFAADEAMLGVHVVLGAFVSMIGGVLAALIAGENVVAPLGAGGLLLAMGIAKAAMSWRLVPLWYHAVFTVMLLPMAVLGGRFFTSA